MPRIAAGSAFPPLTLQSIRGDTVTVPSGDAALAHLQFRRFAGCPICNTHLRSFARRAAELQAGGIREIVFFHSSADELRKHDDGLPFTLVADPRKEFYRRFGVESSLRSVLHPRAWWSALKGLFAGMPGLRMENGALGLPADILVDDAGRVLAVKYGAHAYDQWSVDEVLALAEGARRPAVF